MGKRKVQLFVHSEDSVQRFAAVADESCEKGGTVFRFQAEGAEFELRFAGTVFICRQGGIAYCLELDPSRTTHTEIVTDYGSLIAEVRTIRSEIYRKKGFCYKGEYEMRYGDFVQRHEVEFFSESDGRLQG